METAALEIPRATGEDAAEPMPRRLAALSPAAYQLAVRVLGTREGAEDAVQGAYLNALIHLRSASPPPPAGERTWFLRVVANAARDHRRKEASLKRREAAVGWKEAVPSEPREPLVAALRGALGSLEEKYRVPVALCYEQGLTQHEAAEVLDLPERTVSHYVRVGLDRLRRALMVSGYVALPAAVLGGLKQTAPAVPTRLAGRVEALVARGAAARPIRAVRSLAARRRRASKGGLAMKLVAGIVLAGAVAGVAAVSMPREGSGTLPVGAPAKRFDTPPWHPGAEWERAGWYASSGASGDMDGPRLDFMGRRSPGVSAVGNIKFEGNEKVCLAYDARLDRVHTAAGSATGYLDGPFSRARFVGGHYSARGKSTISLDRRYVYETEPQLKHCLRRMDYARQEVRTLLPDVKGGLAGLVAGKKHALYALTGGNEILMMDADAKVERKVTAQLPEKQGIGHWGCTLALDEDKERLYASRQFVSSIAWLIWYWDLKDGSFHGVLPNKRQGKQTGPIGEGLGFYPELWVRFGPDDPGKNNIWFGCTDMGNVWRLDQEAKEIWALSATEGGGKRTSRVAWVGKGAKPRGWTGHGGFAWVPDGSGDFYIPHDGGGPTILFKRVK